MRPHLALEWNLCLSELIYGDADDFKRREAESGLLVHLRRRGIHVKSVDPNATGCYIIVGRANLERLEAAVRPYNVAIRVGDECCSLSLRRRSQGNSTPSAAKVLSAFHRGNIRVLYLFMDAAQMDVLVADEQALSAIRILNEL